MIGGGFSGAAFAIHLLRDHGSLPVEIVVIEPRDRLGAGLAYGTTDPAHRVNVAASRLSLFAEHPADVDAWLAGEGSIALDGDATLPDGRRYPRRALYGAYVADTLRRVAADARAGSVRHVRASAVAARRRGGGGFAVRLSTGETLEGDVLLIATGHPSPQTPRFLADLPPDRLVRDPWAPDALSEFAPDSDLLVVGTGLTACDVVASLGRRGHRGLVTAVSRRGLLPRPRTTKAVAPFGDFATEPSVTAIALLRAVRLAVRDAARDGRPWEDVIEALRAQGTIVWNALPLVEQRRLLRHLRPFWDVHRFQSAPQIDAAIASAIAAGSLRVIAASIRSVTVDGAALRVVFRPRRSRPATPEAIRVDAVIDCTGPGHRTLVETSEVLRDLARQGVLRADATALGLATDQDSRALDATGRPAADLFVLGPPARAAHGELMGLPQVTAQPRAVARSVADRLEAVYPETRAAIRARLD